MKKIAIACQGGGSHCAYTSGVLAALLRQTRVQGQRLVIDGRYELVGLSGTSGGAISAYLAWLDLLRMREPGWREPAQFAVERFWEGMKAQLLPWPPMFPSPDLLSNWLQLAFGELDGVLPMVSPSPNPITALAQQQLRRSIEEAASPAGTHDGRSPLPLDYLDSAGPSDLPMLMIGAANIDDSDFQPFLSTPKHRPKTDQLLASAALPDLFPAVVVKAKPSPDAMQKRLRMSQANRPALQPASTTQARYWDGLLSQNPPLSDFMSLPFDLRPDEIWIIRINPAMQVRDALKPPVLQMLPGEIRDRRNELAGNLSLAQEKRSIRAINKLVRRHKGLAKTHKLVHVWGIALDGPWDVPDDINDQDGRWCAPDEHTLPLPQVLRDLDATSKLNRFPPFIQALSDYGRDCCGYFLEQRRLPTGERQDCMAEPVEPPASATQCNASLAEPAIDA